MHLSCRFGYLPQFECYRTGTGFAVPKFFCSLGQMIPIFRNSGLLKIHYRKPCRRKCLPVVRQRSMEPDELRSEMGPRWIGTFSRLEVWKAPAILDLLAVFRDSSPALGKTRMGEYQHGQPLRFQNTVERYHRSLKVGDVHKDIICDQQVIVLVLKVRELGAR